MASISSLTGSSSTSSIYGSRNVISGLASGLDTETLIENAIKGYQNKITQLQQQQTMVQWKQDAYRSIIDKMVQLNRKYTSYTSSTNLFSQSFFNKAVTTTALGKNASAVSASGRTNSNVKINSIKSLATSAQYRSSVANSDLLKSITGVVDPDTKVMTATASDAMADLSDKVTVGNLSGGMTVKYGSSSIYLSFDENDVYDTVEDLAKGIEEKLGDAMVKAGSGEYVKASDRIKVEVGSDGTISFSDKSSAKNAVYINSADKALAANLGISKTGEGASSFKPNESNLTSEQDAIEYLAGKGADGAAKSLSVTLNGSTKSISLKDWKENLAKAIKDANYDKVEDVPAEKMKELRNSSFKKTIQDGLDKAFGEGAVKVNFVDATDDEGKAIQKLSFEVKEGDTLSVTSDANKVLGFGENGLTSYLNTSTKLGDILDFADQLDASKNPVYDENGNVKKEPKKLTINGQEFEFDEDTTIESLMNQINNNKEAGVTINYSKLTNQFSITATETGTSGQIDVSGELAGLFGATENKDGVETLKMGDDYTKGTDAVLEVEIDGQAMTLTRTSNTVDFDGMSVTLKETFDSSDADSEPITFETQTDSDKIIDAIQSFVDDYNALVKEVREQYATIPNEKSSTDHSRYMPLTEEDRASMSESAIAAYEEKAKQGILFGSTELAGLHDALRNAVSFLTKNSDSADATKLANMGISTAYESGLTTLDLDVDKLRSALESDPDGVRDMFTKSIENGSKTNGLMQNFQDVFKMYANTTTGSQGILVQMSGSVYAPTSLNSNSLQTEYDNLTTQIEKWQEKMSSQVDYYTTQFTALEQLMSNMNNQSSMLSSLMGGSGY